jgi:lysozyme
MFDFMRRPDGTIKPQAKIAAGGVGAVMLIAIPLVAGFEGYSGKVYLDSVGVKTICYGQTADDGANFSKVYTKAECEQMLGTDLVKYDLMVHTCIHDPIPTHREAALVSFTFNLGRGALCGGLIPRYLNAGNIVAGCGAFLRYNHAGGRVLKGLTDRRKIEQQLCLRND